MSVSLRVDAALEELVLEVADDGRGLPGAVGDRGLGLGSMRRRAEEVGGRCSIERSGPGGGTRLRARFPLEDA